jgi:SAM-dependent methyltransferase
VVRVNESPARSPTAKNRPGLSPEEREGWTATYERSAYQDLPWFSKQPTPWLVRAVEHGWIPKGAAVLDVGCGAGTNVLWLASRGFRAHGVDISPGAVAAARSRAEEAGVSVTFTEGDATNLPFGDGEFAAALDAGCFHTLPVERRNDYAEELYRVVRPGGTLLLIWIGREETRDMGPRHRPSLAEVSATLEPRFIFEAMESHPPDSATGWATPAGSLGVYTTRLVRRTEPQPPLR